MSAISTAAILLCAGKGTRMGGAAINKVAFDCAGVPVIKRIVQNMREGGVERFVVVVGHKAESVMEALKDEKGVLYAYQSEQRGTGHAASCGLQLLDAIGFEGDVIVSMGDKIVSPGLVSDMLAGTEEGVSAVLAVERRPEGPTGRGHVVEKGGKVFGIVEAKDVRKALESGAEISLGGETFRPEEVASATHVNAAMYCFDCAALTLALSKLGNDNAQNEFYLTDTIEGFAAEGSLRVHEVEDSGDLMTFSTRPELRALSRRFLRPIGEFTPAGGSQEKLFRLAASRFGDRGCLVVSVPGRINVMGRHIEHRGGSVNMMAVDRRMTFVVSPRQDDVVSIENTDARFPSASFRISSFVTPPKVSPCQVAATAQWLDFLDSDAARADLENARGHWVNYIKGAVLRFQMSTDIPLCGMDIVVSGDIPVAAGLSSSSALVVSTAEAVVALNALNVGLREFVDLCGEAEWYVGSRGGAGDHAAMKCSRKGFVTHLKFKPFEIGSSVRFPDGCSLLVVHSGEEAKKSEGARDIFNSRIASYERAFADILRAFPGLPVEYFRDIAFLPEEEREKVLEAVSPEDRGVARYGIDECRRAEECLALFEKGDAAAIGRMMKESHSGDRVGAGLYECSTPRIDAICDFLDSSRGVYGSQLVGAGLGGCVTALVDDECAPGLIASLAEKGYESFICEPAEGSQVRYSDKHSSRKT